MDYKRRTFAIVFSLLICLQSSSAVSVSQYDYSRVLLFPYTNTITTDFFSWGQHNSDINLATSLEIDNAYIQLNNDTRTLIFIATPPDRTLLNMWSTVLAFRGTQEIETSIGNILQYIKVYENDGESSKIINNWLYQSNARRFHTSDTEENKLNYLTDKLNFTSQIRYDTIPLGFYSTFDGTTLVTDYFSPYKIFNEYNNDKAMECFIAINLASLDYSKEYVMQVDSLVFASSENGDPNKNLIDQSIEFIHLRFPDFYDNNTRTFNSPPGVTYERVNGKTYLISSLLLLSYVTVFGIRVYSKSSKKSSNEENEDELTKQIYYSQETQYKNTYKSKNIGMSRKEGVLFLFTAIILIRLGSFYL